MRTPPALRIAAALSGALTLVVAIALGAGHAGPSSASAATVRLVSVAHALVEKAARAPGDRLEAAAPASKATQPATAVVAPALPSFSQIPFVVAAAECGAILSSSDATPRACAPSRVHAARGPPRGC